MRKKKQGKIEETDDIKISLGQYERKKGNPTYYPVSIDKQIVKQTNR